MDDEPYTTSVLYMNLFEGPFPWTRDICQDIEQRRGLLNDQLLFDTLLSLGGIREPDTLYPPRDVESLQLLLDAIATSHYDPLKRDCLVYFLLKWFKDKREIKFQMAQSIPPQFCMLADAYWYLDAGSEIAKAVTILADTRLNRDYASKILQAISYSENASSTLIVQYVRTAKPLLIEQEDIALYTLALAEHKFFEAWQFQRSFNELDETRPKLIKKLLEWSVTPSPRSLPLAQLVGLPMSAFEQSIFHAHALHPPNTLSLTSMAVLQDLVCVRLIESGQYAEAVKIDRQFSSVSPLKDHQHLTQERSKMVHEIYISLPQVERAVLDLELDVQDKAIVTNGGDVSMLSSWEDLAASRRHRPSMVNGIGNAPSPIPLDRSLGFLVVPNASMSNGRKSLGSAAAAPLLSTSTSSNLMSSSTVSYRPRTSMGSQPLASSSSSTKAMFESANRRQNAFFQPPKDVSRRQSATSPFILSNVNGNGRRDEDMDQDEEQQQQQQQEDDDVMHTLPSHADMSFSQSVFDNLPSSRPSMNGRRPNGSSVKRMASTQKMPPGAFVEEDDTQGHTQIHQHPQPSPQQNFHAEQPQPQSKPKQARRRAGKQLPGALLDDDDDDDEEEEEEVAPLRAVSPPRRGGRKGRASSVEDTGEGRRRSSRLSAVPSAGTGVKKRTTTGGGTSKGGRKKKAV